MEDFSAVRSKVMLSHCGFFVTWLVSITAAFLRLSAASL
jgi:hypothetical protein